MCAVVFAISLFLCNHVTRRLNLSGKKKVVFSLSLTCLPVHICGEKPRGLEYYIHLETLVSLF